MLPDSNMQFTLLLPRIKYKHIFYLIRPFRWAQKQQQQRPSHIHFEGVLSFSILQWIWIIKINLLQFQICWWMSSERWPTKKANQLNNVGQSVTLAQLIWQIKNEIRSFAHYTDEWNLFHRSTKANQSQLHSTRMSKYVHHHHYRHSPSLPIT